MRIFGIILAAVAGAAPSTAALAQTLSGHDTTTAYGARLDARGAPVETNRTRLDNRLRSRIDSRLSLRIERYRPDTANDPVAAFRTTQDNGIHFTPVAPAAVPSPE